MKFLKKVLVANRGEIACRLIEGCKKENIETIAIYSKEDANCPHVIKATKAVLLTDNNNNSSNESQAYIDIDQIISIAIENKAQAIIPGYGFLSENEEFVDKLNKNNLLFIGPSVESIKFFGLKHLAREFALKSKIPIIPGNDGLINSEDEALKIAQEISYPIIIKSTAGGGGMGLKICYNSDELKENITKIKARSNLLFKNSGIFIEKYIKNSRHIEVQIFGNGLGDVITFGERECSIQRRHQKVIEESPSPFVAASLTATNNKNLRSELCNAAVSLAKLTKYKSAGTVEFLVDDDTSSFYFLEMNTRLQVEHGITELTYDIDLVYLMLLQADYELSGSDGIPSDLLNSFAPNYTNGTSTTIIKDKKTYPNGAAIEVRLYAENPIKDFAPSPGILHNVYLPNPNEFSYLDCKIRIDHWIETGTKISPYFDPLLAKIMVWAPNRLMAIKGMIRLLDVIKIQGPPTNLNYLKSIISNPQFESGFTLTSFLSSEQFINYYKPNVIEFISSGAYTTIQDLPGRINVNGGIPISGPMDLYSFKIANSLVGNDSLNTEALEITFSGPIIKFYSDTLIALTGGEFEFKVNGILAPMWSTIYIKKGSIVSIGNSTGSGARAYLAIKGGFPNVANYLGSKSCSPTLKIGGHQGRTIFLGDCLEIDPLNCDYTDFDSKSSPFNSIFTLPNKYVPKYEGYNEKNKESYWKIRVIPGPHDTSEILSKEGRDLIYNTVWKVNHNSNRGALKLDGPKPIFSRLSGKDGGRHPSNILEYGYPTCGISFTGDNTVLFGVDGATLSGFVCVATPIESDWWKFGQAKPGEGIKFIPVSWEDAIEIHEKRDAYIDSLSQAINKIKAGLKSKSSDNKLLLPDVPEIVFEPNSKPYTGKTILWHREESVEKHLPFVEFRQAGESMIVIDFGIEKFDLMNCGRQYSLSLILESEEFKKQHPDIYKSILRTESTSGSLVVVFDSLKLKINRDLILKELIAIENSLPPSEELKIQSRIFKLPIAFKHSAIDSCIERYIKSQRPYASYLPDNTKFLMDSSAIDTFEKFKSHVVGQPEVITAISFLCALPIFVHVDPRLRFMTPKYNPARTFTPAGAIGTGSLGQSIYSVDSPGGYMLWGMTLPDCCWNTFSRLNGFKKDKPWLFNLFDQIVFYEVNEEELTNLNLKLLSHEFELEYKDSVFDFKNYKKFVDSISDEVEEIRLKQIKANNLIMDEETELLKKWENEKLLGKGVKSNIEELLVDPNNKKVQSPMNASVWKINVKKGDIISDDDILIVLEAMKMEIPVRLNLDSKKKYEVLEIIVDEGDVVLPGDNLIIIK